MGRDPTCGQVNAGELARIFGVSRKWIYQLEKQGMPRAGRLFDVAAATRWYLAELKAAQQDTDPEDLVTARMALYKAQTERTELENARLRGELVDREEAQTVLYEVASIVATQHDAVAPRIAGLIVGENDVKRIQTVLFEEHRAIREAIAGTIERLATARRSDDPTATESHSGPVGGPVPDIATGEPGAGEMAD